mgnify:CR=1 FL=1
MSAYQSLLSTPTAAKRAKTLLVFFIIYILTTVLSIFAELNEIKIYKKILIEGSSSEVDEMLSILMTTFFGFLQFIVLIITYVLFLMWIHRAYRNVMVLHNDELKYSPGWAVGSYFIPFVNLVLPFLVMREIWKGSSPHGKIEDRLAWKKEKGSALLIFWWLFWLLSNHLSTFVFRLYWRADTPEEYITANWFSITSSIIEVILTLLVLFVVHTINRRQSEKRKKLEEYYQRQSSLGAESAPQEVLKEASGVPQGISFTEQREQDVPGQQHPNPQLKGRFVWKK